MNGSLRMILVLGLIAAVAAGALAGVNAWTAPIIEEKTALRLQNTLSNVLEAEEFEEQEGTELTLWHAYAGGELVGYVVRLLASGYSPSGIDLLVGIDAEGTVRGVHIFGHQETPGLGDKIESKWFLEQFVDLGIADDIASGVDVDGISGATSSANGVIVGVRRAVQFVGEYAGLIEDAGIINLADIPDGTYTGSARGFIDTIVVEVTIEGGKLVSVVIVEVNDTPSYAGPAVEQIPRAMVDEQRLDVDVVSGSTGTSEGIINAVRDALAEFASGEIEITALASGRYAGKALGFDGEIAVEVEIEDGVITAIRVLFHNDTPAIAGPAFDEMIDKLLAAQSLDVDVVGGATSSSQGLLAAVKNALMSRPKVDIDQLADGNYFGTVDSFGGPLTVKVVVAGGEIKSIEVLEHKDTPDFAEPVFAEMIERLLAAQDLDVDLASGATISAQGLLDAVEAALRSQPRLDLSAVPDGEYLGSAEAFGGTLELVVTIADGAIVVVEVLSHNDTPDFAEPAFAELEERVLAEQNIYVDIVSGATFSSRGWLEALEAALRQALSD